MDPNDNENVSNAYFFRDGFVNAISQNQNPYPPNVMNPMYHQNVMNQNPHPNVINLQPNMMNPHPTTKIT